jgi:hypothetical protein
MAHKVFISYSSKDKPVADAACAAMESQRIPCWIAPRDILAGDEYGDAIIDAISNCQIVVVIFSLHANDSPQVRREVERAVSKGKIIVPYRIEDVMPTHAMEFALSNTHWLDALTPPLEHRLTELCDTVARIIQRHAAEPLWQLEPAAEVHGVEAEPTSKQSEPPQAIVVELPSAVEELHRAQEEASAVQPVAPVVAEVPVVATVPSATSEHSAATQEPVAPPHPVPLPVAPVAPAPLPFVQPPVASSARASAGVVPATPKKRSALRILAWVAGAFVLLFLFMAWVGSRLPKPANGPSPTGASAPAAGAPATADATPAAAAGAASSPAAETAAKAAAAEPELSAAASRKRDLWLSQPLQGGDNEAAHARLVTIAKGPDGYVITIANQFGFSCGLHFNQAGDPATLTDCASKDQPGWTADEKVIPLSCGRQANQMMCTGTYTLRSENLADKSVMRFGYKP